MLTPEAVGRASVCPQTPCAGPPTIPQGPTEMQTCEDDPFYSACPPSTAQFAGLTWSHLGWDTPTARTDGPRGLPHLPAGTRSKEAPSSDQEAPNTPLDPGARRPTPVPLSQQTLPELLTRRPMAHLREKKLPEVNLTHSGGANK